MKVTNPSNYKFKGFKKSHLPTKKYDAILENKTTGKIKHVPFGAKGYEQYKDKAMGLYSKQDHNDLARRTSYRKRHQGEQNNKYSSGWFAWKYLW